MQLPPPWMQPHLMYGPPPRPKATPFQVVATAWAAIFGVGTLAAFAYWILSARNASVCSQYYAYRAPRMCPTVLLYHPLSLIASVICLAIAVLLAVIGLRRRRY